ncbi:MAG: YraN family protein [Actinomycetaceae bacterium]|nr:YraN family protein [Actinomycetaceae bacterium]MDY5854589.1 YraN family protein [Arcanobacterium sp.]
MHTHGMHTLGTGKHGGISPDEAHSKSEAEDEIGIKAVASAEANTGCPNAARFQNVKPKNARPKNTRPQNGRAQNGVELRDEFAAMRAQVRAHPISRNELGAWGERCAERYLVGEGLNILARNWRTRGGELDLVAYDPARKAVVAVEVKTRRQRGGYFPAGTPEEAITPTKLRRIRALLAQWILTSGQRANAIAVDVVAVAVCADRFSVRHVKDVQ